jgi:hypothetical protein
MCYGRKRSPDREATRPPPSSLEAEGPSRNGKPMKNFVIGAVVGAFLVYAYFEYYGGDLGPPSWLGGAASGYRGDKTHEKAKEALQ